MCNVEIYFPWRSGKHSVYLLHVTALLNFHPAPFHSAKTQFAMNWKKLTGFWANSTLKLLGSNISQYSRGMFLLKLPLSSRLISCCFTVPKWMINLLQIWERVWGYLMPGNKKNPWGREAIKKKNKKTP